MSIHDFIKHKIGIDGAILYTILGKGIGAFTTVFTVLFIARYLSPDEQGYYYTFASIVSIQVFFELGLNSIITQFVAHEASYLTINSDDELEGNSVAKSRLAHLLRFCTRWYLVFACILLIALLIAGLFFFRKYSIIEGVVWKWPWILLAITSVLNFLTAPINAFMQGLGKVREIAKIRFVQQICIPIFVWGGLMLGAKLFVPFLQTTITIFVNIYLFRKLAFVKILRNLYKHTISARINYRYEIFPYQWRIALSWISGYFTFQLFNPVLFAAEGAVAAGQMGMTIAAASAIQSVLLSWINTKIPLLSGMIEQKQYIQLDKVFITNLKRICIFALCLYSLFIGFVVCMQHVQGSLGSFGHRFVSFAPLMLMCIAIGLQIPINAWATYLRCFLKEPFLVNSVTLGVTSVFLVMFLGPRYGTLGLSIGYLVVQIISVIWANYIFRTKRIEYQK